MTIVNAADVVRRLLLELVPPPNDGGAILHRVAGDDEVALEPGEVIAGSFSIEGVKVDSLKF